MNVIIEDKSIEDNFLAKHKSNKALKKQYFKTKKLLELSPPFTPSLKKHKLTLKGKYLYSILVGTHHYKMLIRWDDINDKDNIYILYIDQHDKFYNVVNALF